MPSDPRPLEIQALFFAVPAWTRDAAETWCAEHDHTPVDWRERTDEEGEVSHHIAVLWEPDAADPESFRTIADDFPEGISASLATRRSADPSRQDRTRALAAVERTRGAQSQADPLEFVLSDGSSDRTDWVIEPGGWELAEFRRNPIALFAHDHMLPIGTWERVRVEGKRLLGHLKLAAPGTSPLVDQVRSFIEQRILRAVSVGFRPLEVEDIADKDGRWLGYRFLRQALHEVSVVAVPANANALALARSLNLSPKTRALIFTGDDRAASGTKGRSGPPGAASGASPQSEIARRPPMDGNDIDDGAGTPIPTLIKTKERDLTRAELELEQLEAEIREAGDMSDEQDTKLDGLTETIARLAQSLTRFRKMEMARASIAAGGNGPSPGPAQFGSGPGLIRGPAAREERKPGALFSEWCAANIVALGKGVRLEQASEQLFGRGPDRGKHLRVMQFQDGVTGSVSGIERAAVAPASTTDPVWLGGLVGDEVQGFIESLGPNAVLPKLLARPSVARARFGPGVNTVTIPVEVDVARPIGAAPGTPVHAAPEFFAEGGPIRVGQFRITEWTLMAKETGVIIPWTRKLEMYSSIDLVAFIERVIRRHTARRLDDILLSATPMTAVSPQGLADPAIPGFTTTAFSSSTPGNPSIEEIEDAVGALIDALGPVAQDPVLIVPMEIANKLARPRLATGQKAFADELAAGTLMGASILTHNTGPVDVIYGLDAAQFICAYGTPDFDLSSEATLHMEDTTPLPLVTGAGPTVATPQRNLFQTASRAVRMILDASWAVAGSDGSHRLTGFVA